MFTMNQVAKRSEMDTIQMEPDKGSNQEEREREKRKGYSLSNSVGRLTGYSSCHKKRNLTTRPVCFKCNLDIFC